MSQDENAVKERKKTVYHSFLDQRLPEIKQVNPNLSNKDAYSIAREEWCQKKNQEKPIIKKSRGRPKKIVNENQDNDSISSNKSNVSNGKRGRPPKNPLINHIPNFEKFLIDSEKWSENKDSKQAQDELGIDEQTFILFLDHLEANSELRQLLNKKNAPKKSRGRPKGSKIK